MKKTFFVPLIFCFISILGFTQGATNSVAATSSETIVLRGVLVDNMNADENNATLGEFIKTYTKASALKPESIARGYSIFAEGKRYPFDGISCGKVAEFLKKTDSKLQVSVVVVPVDNEVNLVLIENHM